MPATLQTRFLRVLQEREFRPLGSTKTLKADFRLVAATNQQMTRALRDGRPAARVCTTASTPSRSKSLPCATGGKTSPRWRLCSSNAIRSADEQARNRSLTGGRARPACAISRGPATCGSWQNAIEYAVVLAKENLITEESLPVRTPPAPAAARPDHGVLFRQRRAQRLNGGGGIVPLPGSAPTTSTAA